MPGERRRSVAIDAQRDRVLDPVRSALFALGAKPVVDQPVVDPRSRGPRIVVLSRYVVEQVAQPDHGEGVRDRRRVGPAWKKLTMSRPPWVHQARSILQRSSRPSAPLLEAIDGRSTSSSPCSVQSGVPVVRRVGRAGGELHPAGATGVPRCRPLVGRLG